MWKQCSILQQWETNHGVVHARELKGHQNKAPVGHFLRNHLTECAELFKWYGSLAQASFPLEGALLIYCHHLCEEPTPSQRREAPMQVLRSGKYCCRNAAFPCPLHVREKYTMGTNCSWLEKSATGLISHAEDFFLLLWHSGKISFLWHHYQLMLFMYNHPGNSAWVWSFTFGKCQLGI